MADLKLAPEFDPFAADAERHPPQPWLEPDEEACWIAVYAAAVSALAQEGETEADSEVETVAEEYASGAVHALRELRREPRWRAAVVRDLDQADCALVDCFTEACRDCDRPAIEATLRALDWTTIGEPLGSYVLGMCAQISHLSGKIEAARAFAARFPETWVARILRGEPA